MLIRAHGRRRVLIAATATAAAAACALGLGVGTSSAGAAAKVRAAATTTPIQHVVVIFDENVSFDHYFATYPKATNSDGTTFHAAKSTPKVNNLASAHLLETNPNLYTPSRLAQSQAMTCDQNHNYGPEQKAMNNGKNDQYVQNVSVDTCTGLYGSPGLTMDYYDGNTVTGLWNLAQNYSMNDNSYDSTFGPSTPGALNLISGQTHGFAGVNSTTGVVDPTGKSVVVSPDASGTGTVIADPDPAYDDCSDKNHTSTNNLAKAVTGKNIGDLLNAKGVTWGWFQGGFKPSTSFQSTGTYAQCNTTHKNLAGASVVDYSPHHNPFAYYASTSNPHHLRPKSVANIGKTDQANHNYDLSDFNMAITHGTMPAVSFLKAGEYQDGHAGYSDPIDEQHFLVNEINTIESSKFWKNTAIVIAYDDSDGWYDHVTAHIKNGSSDAANDSTLCLNAASTVPLAFGQEDRCGPGTRQPLLVISPYSKTNFVDHSQTETASITKWIETNWKTGQVGGGSFDARANSLNNMFNFSRFNNRLIQLRGNGSVRSVSKICKKTVGKSKACV